MNDNEHLDKILDDALSEYREAEPLAGIEDRVLQRLRLQTDDRRTAWWKWGAVAACAALALMAAWVGAGNHRVRSLPLNAAAPQRKVAQTPRTTPDGAKTSNDQWPVEIASRHAATPDKPAQVAHRGPFEHMTTAAARDSSELRMTQFPSPAPLTPEEHALLALARTHPETLLNRPEPARELFITPIDIKLLPEPNGDSEGDN